MDESFSDRFLRNLRRTPLAFLAVLIFVICAAAAVVSYEAAEKEVFFALMYWFGWVMIGLGLLCFSINLYLTFHPAHWRGDSRQLED